MALSYRPPLLFSSKLRILSDVIQKFCYQSSSRTLTNFVKPQSVNFNLVANYKSIGNILICRRFKYSKKQQKSDDPDEDSDDEIQDSNIDDGASKVVSVNMSSLRMDGVVKAGLGVARNKIEVLFYESRIRLNGKKVLKKSVQVGPGDEVDIIKGFNKLNPAHLNVSRVVLLSAKPDFDTNELKVKLRRYKSIPVENYPEHPWEEK